MTKEVLHVYIRIGLPPTNVYICNPRYVSFPDSYPFRSSANVLLTSLFLTLLELSFLDLDFPHF